MFNETQTPLLTHAHFTDLVQAFTFDKTKAPKAKRWSFMDYRMRTGNQYKAIADIGPYCAVDSIEDGIQPSLWIEPTETLVTLIQANMIPTVGGIYFKLLIRKDGTASLYAEYNSIIGSRWIADIDAREVPHGEQR